METNTRYVEGYLIARKYVNTCYLLALELWNVVDGYFRAADSTELTDSSDPVSARAKQVILGEGASTGGKVDGFVW